MNLWQKILSVIFRRKPKYVPVHVKTLPCIEDITVRKSLCF